MGCGWELMESRENCLVNVTKSQHFVQDGTLNQMTQSQFANKNTLELLHGIKKWIYNKTFYNIGDFETPALPTSTPETYNCRCLSNHFIQQLFC